MHHLAGIGHLLGSVIQSPLSQWTYLQVRNVLLAMVDLLASLESVLTTSTEEGGSARLKAHVARIDQYMTNAALERQQSQVYHSALPKEAWGGGNGNGGGEALRSTVSAIAYATGMIIFRVWQMRHRRSFADSSQYSQPASLPTTSTPTDQSSHQPNHVPHSTGSMSAPAQKGTATELQSHSRAEEASDAQAQIDRLLASASSSNSHQRNQDGHLDQYQTSMHGINYAKNPDPC